MPDSTKDKYIGKAKLDLGEFAGNNKVCRWLRVVRFWCTLQGSRVWHADDETVPVGKVQGELGPPGDC